MYVLGATQFNQLCKLQNLYHHFVEHQQENKDMSFADFIVLHYFDSTHPDDDIHKDKELPFKSHVTQASVLAIAGVQQITLSQPVFVQTFYTRQLHVEQPDFYQSLLLRNIFQPPRITHFV